MPHIRMRDGARLHYHDLGRGDPVILLHGFAMPAALWLPFAIPLMKRYRFILPDLRGFGGSHQLALSNNCLLSQHANDLADLIEDLNLHDIRLGGLSMGACTAMQYHRLHGFERVHSYLHIDQSPCVRNGPDWQHGLLGSEQASRLGHWHAVMDELKAYRKLPYEQLPKALRRALWNSLSEFFGAAFHQPHWKLFTRLAQHELLIRRVAPTANWPIYLDSVRSYMEDDYDWRASLPAIEVPMTVLIGADSVMYPAAGQAHIAELVPHAKVVTINNCGHAIPFEAPKRFHRELREFLAAA